MRKSSQTPDISLLNNLASPLLLSLAIDAASVNHPGLVCDTLNRISKLRWWCITGVPNSSEVAETLDGFIIFDPFPEDSATAKTRAFIVEFSASKEHSPFWATRICSSIKNRSWAPFFWLCKNNRGWELLCKWHGCYTLLCWHGNHSRPFLSQHWTWAKKGKKAFRRSRLVLFEYSFPLRQYLYLVAHIPCCSRDRLRNSVWSSL